MVPHKNGAQMENKWTEGELENWLSVTIFPSIDQIFFRAPDSGNTYLNFEPFWSRIRTRTDPGPDEELDLADQNLAKIRI